MPDEESSTEMAYRIRRKDKSVEKAVRRIAREQLGKALDALEEQGDRSYAVHDVRKRCKKLRGLIRLVRPAFPDFAEENEAFRDAAALLAAQRDAQVALDSFDLLVAEANGLLQQDSLLALRNAFTEAVEPERDDGLSARLDECRERLGDARKRARHWKLQADGWEAVCGGVEKTYARAFESAQRANAEGTDEALHQLRKRMKYHWYHIRLLEKLDLQAFGKRAKRARDLTEVLGQHHDLAILEARLREHVATPDPNTAETMLVLCSRRRAMLENRSSDLLTRLVKQKPDELVSDWHSKWKAWRR